MLRSRLTFPILIGVAFFGIPLSLSAPAQNSAAAQVLTIIPTNRAIEESKSPLAAEKVHHLLPGALPAPVNRPTLPQVFSPSRPRTQFTRYPWKNDIMTTVFWIGEKPTPRNPTPNWSSSWDIHWKSSFGGFDDPNNREGFLPKSFVPKQNPFYIALPYNDVSGGKTKEASRANIPWFKESFYREGRTVVKGRWLAIRRGSKVCYGQWEDVGPFETNNWEYVFGDERPRTKGNKGAGLDVSPAIRDYLGFKWSAVCDWRFVELHEVPDGPWKKWGNNNPFADNLPKSNGRAGSVTESIIKLREIREKLNPGVASKSDRDATSEDADI